MLMTKAYAKINLGLNVVNKDETDGYHYLDMVMMPVELHDRIEIDILPQGYDTLITSDDVELPTDETNIVFKIEKVLREKYKYQQKFRIHIHKIIPIGAGLGGGSADGAAVLLGLNKLLKLNMSIEEMCELGSKVGSDIPFCVRNIAARVQGKGNILTPIKTKKEYGVLIVQPPQGLSTKEVYQKFDEVGSSSNCDIENLIKGLATNDFEMIKNSLGNQLEDAATTIYPEINKVKDLMLSLGLDNAIMTGSGSAIFSISKDIKLLKSVFNKMTSKGYKVILTKTR